jgi:hypothetical protein
VRDRLLQGAAIGYPALGTLERIDENAERRKLRQFTQKMIRQYPDVRAHSRQDLRQKRPVENSKWVIGNGDHRP